MNLSKYIHLIRHGLTEANIKGLYAGVTDIPVCEEGIKRLENLKKHYSYPEIQKCYSSPLTRCLQTCNTLYPHAEPIVQEGFQECNFGVFEGKTIKDLEKDELFLKWINDNIKYTPPEGERIVDFHKRILMTFGDTVHNMFEDDVDSVAIFTHGGVIMHLLPFLHEQPTTMLDWVVDNGCGYSLKIEKDIWENAQKCKIEDQLPNGFTSDENFRLLDLLTAAKKIALNNDQ